MYVFMNYGRFGGGISWRYKKGETEFHGFWAQDALAQRTSCKIYIDISFETWDFHRFHEYPGSNSAQLEGWVAREIPQGETKTMQGRV